MNFRFAVFALLLGCVPLAGLAGAAEPVYVTDVTEITLRAGPSTGHKVIAMLTSGQPLEVAETKEGWSRVKVLSGDGAGRTGWVLSRYLITRPPWQIQFDAMRTLNEDLKDRYSNFDQRWQELAAREQRLVHQVEEGERALAEVRAQYEELKQISGDSLRFKEEFDRVRAELETAQQDRQRLEHENRSLKYSQNLEWFAAGALVPLGGWLIGFVMGRRPRRRPGVYR